jgi:hypothetical protein
MPTDVVDQFGKIRTVWISGRFGYQLQPCYSPAGKFVYYIVEKISRYMYIRHDIPFGDEKRARSRAMELGKGAEVERPYSSSPLDACYMYPGCYSGINI